MKKAVFLVIIILIGIISCQKEESFNFENIEFKDLRKNPNNFFTLVDVPREIITYEDRGGQIDTLGETKLFYDDILLTYRNWETSYMTPKHGKTDFFYAYHEKVMIVLIKPDYMFFDQMFIISNRVRKEFSVGFIDIKLAEVDTSNRIIRITHNNSWVRPGEMPDEIKEFHF